MSISEIMEAPEVARAKKENYIVAPPTIVSEDMLVRVIEKIQTEGERFLKESKPKVSGGSNGFLGFSAGLPGAVSKVLNDKVLTYVAGWA